MKKIYYLLTFLVMLTVAVRAGAQCAGGMPQCQILVEMHDGYGDGWNNGQLYVYQGTTLRGTVTLNSGSAGESAVSVCSASASARAGCSMLAPRIPTSSLRLSARSGGC